MSWLPSPEYADWWYDLSWKGIIGFGAFAAFATAATVVFTVIQFWSDGIRDQRADERSEALSAQVAAAHTKTAELEREAAALKAQSEADRLARVKIEARIAPRSMTQAQQNELTAKLVSFKRVVVIVQASPSTQESEWFARVLGAPLKAAGWSVTIAPGTETATVLQPPGVIVWYPLQPHVAEQDDPNFPAASALAAALNEIGIAASALPGPLKPPQTMGIIIGAK